MAKNKVTMKDIAREVNVSAATVSYVLNYSDKEKISNETRVKVMEAAKRLHYVPNLAARSLAGTDSRMIGMVMGQNREGACKRRYQYDDMIWELQGALHKRGYDMMLLSAGNSGEELEVISGRSLDGLFMVGMEEESLRELTHRYFIPIILVDSHLGDSLFYEVLTDYEMVLQETRELLGVVDYVVLEDADGVERQFAEKNFSNEDIYYFGTGQGLADFLERKRRKKGLILGEILGMQAEKYADNRNFAVMSAQVGQTMLLSDTKKITVSNGQKAEAAVDMMIRLLKMDDMKENAKCIYIRPQ